MKVVFYGGRHFNNPFKLYEAFYLLQQDMGMAEIATTDEQGGPTVVAELARGQAVACRVVPALWRVHGVSAEAHRRVVLLEQAPDLVVLLPGGETDEMAVVCEAAGIDVWDLTSVPSIKLGDGSQVGEDEMPADEAVF
jgi:hypothetical protein